MVPAEAFRLLLSRLTPVMKTHGFRRYRSSYRIYKDENVGLVDVQKSRRTNSERVIFTINIGVFSRRLARFFSSGEEVDNVSITDCHFNLRVADLLESSDDKWWTITYETDVDDLYAEVGSIVCESAIPVILSHISDEALRDRALSGSLPGATDMMMLEYLSILVRDLGPVDQLPEVLMRLQGIARDDRQLAVIESHIRDLQRGA